MSVHLSRPEHEIAYQDVVALIRKHADKLTALELLAIAANMVGKLIALQDQRTTTPTQALETVSANIEMGNSQAMAEVQESKGTS